jgi:hypothetical protein
MLNFYDLVLKVISEKGQNILTMPEGIKSWEKTKIRIFQATYAESLVAQISVPKINIPMWLSKFEFIYFLKFLSMMEKQNCHLIGRDVRVKSLWLQGKKVLTANNSSSCLLASEEDFH